MPEKNNKIGQFESGLIDPTGEHYKCVTNDIQGVFDGKNLYLNSVLISLSGNKFDALNGNLRNLGCENLDFAKKVLLYECVDYLLSHEFDLSSKDYSYALGLLSSLGLNPLDNDKLVQLINELKYDFSSNGLNIYSIDSPFYGLTHFEEIMNNRVPIEFSYNKCVQNLRKCMSGEKNIGLDLPDDKIVKDRIKKYINFFLDGEAIHDKLVEKMFQCLNIDENDKNLLKYIIQNIGDY